MTDESSDYTVIIFGPDRYHHYGIYAADAFDAATRVRDHHAAAEGNDFRVVSVNPGLPLVGAPWIDLRKLGITR